MRKASALGILASVTAVATLASAQQTQPQPQPQPTTSIGVQPLPPPQTTTAAPTQSAAPLPLPTIAPTASAHPTVTATATVPPPPLPSATATVTATATVAPPPPPPTATATATATAPPPPPTATATATTTAPPPPPPPLKPTPATRRDDGEMVYLYATSAAFGITMGSWIDTLSLCSPNNKKKDANGNVILDTNGNPINQCDPAGALVSPLLLGTLFPLGFFLWDNFYKGGMHRGVPSSIGTGLIIGALEGLGVAGANYAIAGDASGKRWGSDGIMTSIFVGSALGGIGGYAFGEAVRPNPRKIALVASGAGWGALMGAFMGGGAADSDPPSIGQGMLVGNLVGINVGLATTGILAAVGYDPSWAALKYMWMGAGIGLVATSPIYLIYVASQSQDNTTNCGDSGSPHGCPLVNHGMVANGLGMLAGVVIAGILTRDLKDTPAQAEPSGETPSTPPASPNGQPAAPAGPTARARTWTPPVTFSFSPLPNGGMFGLSGQW
jgi:hypothetical protein